MAAASASEPAASAQTDQGNQPPLSFKIGNADFTPLGFLDFTSVYRSTDVGSGIGTSFGSIPFNGTSPAGRLSELRFSAQNSRVGIKVDANPTANLKVTGYLEADFLGNAPANLEVTSHSSTLRMRLYWVQVRRGKWEFLGGQSWSMMTPNRTGISPMPGDIFFSQDMDTNYQVGLVWLRTPGFRVIFHGNDHWTLGFALEDPEQYTGGLTTLPAGFNATQIDDSGGNSKTPNVGPDVIAKLAYDTKMGGRGFHIEASGVFSRFKLNTAANLAGNNVNVSKSGGGGSVNLNLEAFKNLHIIANTFWSDGGGRYIFGLGPDFVVNVDANGNFVPSPLHAGSGIFGFEYQFKPMTMLYGYYGGAYFGRNFQQVTAGPPPTFTGYGFPGSGSAQNRTIQEGTIGVIQTLWKNRNYGDLKLITQGSYLVRSPWSTTGTPNGAKNAHLGMGFVNLRYDLP
ncbi:MAG TPA: hypothetical protein VGT03_05160 [Candidatus Acidoferrales bacterium]|nr:hypothetical protein [Candidatus Acidoferrales bacterium]